MIKAAIFDMDGLLIDSEPLWRRAEIAVFQRVGIKLTDKMCGVTMGLRTDEVVAYWYARFPWSDRTQNQVETELLAEVHDLIVAHGQPMAGVFAALDALRDAGLTLGIASSSPHNLIHAVVTKLGVADYFSVLSSAADERRGKPDPAVYLSAARKLEVNPQNCLAFEDSIAGVKSAKAAGMWVIAVPDEHNYAEPDFEQSDIKLRSLNDFDVEMIERMRGNGRA